MADRSVKVRLEADTSGYVQGLRTAAKATQDFAKKGSEWVDHHRESINDVSNMALGAGAALTGFSLLSIKSAADFDESMSSVAAATMAPQAELDQLRQAAIEAGASTKYSATEAAAGIEELAKAGVSTADILSGGLAGALDLAASDNIEVAQAAEIASSAMTQFKLEGKDVSHVADLLAAGAGKAQGGVADLGYALSQAGLVASQTGLSIEETVGGLTAFASAGMLGSDAGTSFKSMLQRLSNPAGKAKQEMDELGISAYDAQGNFVGLAELAGQMQTAMEDLTPAQRQASMSIIFGSDAVRAASILYDQGEAGIRDWIAAVDDQGYAAEMAAKRMDNLKGDIEEMQGALETAMIGAGDGAQTPLRSLVQGVTTLINAFNALPGPVQSAFGVGTGIAGMSLLAVGGLGKAVIAANDAKKALDDLGISASVAGKGLKALGTATLAGIAISALASIFAGFARKAAEAESASQGLAAAFDEVTGKANDNADFLILEKLNEHISAADWDKLNELGYTYQDFVDAIVAGGPELEKFRDQLHKDWSGARLFSDERGALSNAVGGVEAVGKGYKDAADQAATAADQFEQTGASAEGASTGQDALTAAVEATDVSLDGVIEDMKTFLDLLFQTGLATMTARDAEAAYQESLAGIGEALDAVSGKAGGLSAALNESKTDFDLTTEAGREANSAFQELAQGGMDRVRAQAEAGVGLPGLQEDLSQTYDDLVAAAGQFGITGDAADALARSVLGVPDGVDIDSWMDNQAKLMAENTKSAVDGIDRNVTIRTNYVTTGKPPTTGIKGNQFTIVGPKPNADGNIYPSVRAFANGTENHVAQIAPAGAWRLWAEPETGGEAYIPLAASKRARSTAILADVANRFGYQLHQAAQGMVMDYAPRRTLTAGGSTGPAFTYSPTINGPDANVVAAESFQRFQHWTATESTGVRGA